MLEGFIELLGYIYGRIFEWGGSNQGYSFATDGMYLRRKISIIHIHL